MSRKKRALEDKVDSIRNPEGLWINSADFSYEAKRFQKYGRYCDYEPGTLGYQEYWEEQLRRCTEGYSIGGAKITGPHYEYLNFCPIKRTDESNVQGVSATKVRDFPDFWDYDYNYFHVIEIARKGIAKEDLEALRLEVSPKSLGGGHHVIVAKCRRRGYSYKGSVLAHNAYNTVRNSLTLLTAFEYKYMYPKGVLAMFNQQLSFIDINTGWSKRREYANTTMHKRASYKKIVNGTPTEAGYKSEILALTFKDNPDASRGGDAYVVLMDEAGEWPGLEQAYKVLQPLCEDGKYVTGQIVIYGTSGDMESGSVDFAKMFYEPESYNLMAFDNIWDDDGEGDSCGFFVPDYKNKVGFIDPQGNSNKKEAKAYEEDRRRRMLDAGKKEAFNQHIMEYPFTPSEAFLVTGDNKFPLAELRKHRLHLERSGMYKGVPIELYWEQDVVKYSVDLDNKLSPLYRYGGTPKDVSGCVIMYEKPDPYTKYCMGYDTIQQDDGSSLAAFQVFKNAPLSNEHGKLVCSFYGRGKGPDDCDQKAMMVAVMYNEAELMHENMFRSTKNNFKMWNRSNLLASQPDLVIRNMIRDSKVEREFGIHMTDRIKIEATLMAARRLEKVVGYNEDGSQILYLQTIRDIRLIEELIRFNFKGNFDAVMAFLMYCILDEEHLLESVSNNSNTKGVGTQFEELRNYHRIKGAIW